MSRGRCYLRSAALAAVLSAAALTAAPSVRAEPPPSAPADAPADPSAMSEPPPPEESWFPPPEAPTTPAEPEARPELPAPRPDADGDGLWDAVDECPEQPETRNGSADDDGCPDSLPPPDPGVCVDARSGTVRWSDATPPDLAACDERAMRSVEKQRRRTEKERREAMFERRNKPAMVVGTVLLCTGGGTVILMGLAAWMGAMNGDGSEQDTPDGVIGALVGGGVGLAVGIPLVAYGAPKIPKRPPVSLVVGLGSVGAAGSF